MREIKFRAWDKEQKSMFRVDNLRWVLFGSPEEVSGVSVSDGQNSCHSGRGHVLMQYTGLKDKNGVEIYEGDILSYFGKTDAMHSGTITGAVRWDNHRCGFFPMTQWYSQRGDAVEVIGNIYESPELLEK